ncbi:reverse transcriptase domain-containing protein [Tanacetum coccineum]
MVRKEKQLANYAWFERTKSVFSHSRCAKENKVTFATGTLTDDALSWWNAYAQPMGVEQANQITWTELKRLLTNKYYPRTEIKKMEEELYNLTVKGNDLKPYVRRFQELTILCVLETSHYARDAISITLDLVLKSDEEKTRSDYPRCQEFLDVFLKIYLDPSSRCQESSKIDLIPGAALLARTPYRLAPSKMQKLSNQLQELADRGTYVDLAKILKMLRTGHLPTPHRDALSGDETNQTTAEVKALIIKLSNNYHHKVLKAQKYIPHRKKMSRDENLRGMDKSFEIRPDGFVFLQSIGKNEVDGQDVIGELPL